MLKWKEGSRLFQIEECFSDFPGLLLLVLILTGQGCPEAVEMTLDWSMNWIEVCVCWYFFPSPCSSTHPFIHFSSNDWLKANHTTSTMLIHTPGRRGVIRYNPDQLFEDKCNEVSPNLYDSRPGIAIQCPHLVLTINLNWSQLFSHFIAETKWGQKSRSSCGNGPGIDSVWVGIRTRCWVPETLFEHPMSPRVWEGGSCGGEGYAWNQGKKNMFQEERALWAEGEVGQRVPTGKRWAAAKAGKGGHSDHSRTCPLL